MISVVPRKGSQYGVERLPRVGVWYGTAGGWLPLAARMGDGRLPHWANCPRLL